MGSNTKQVASLILVNLALFAFVSANAVCPTLDVCINTPLVGVQLGSKVNTQCCNLINGILAADVEACLCNLLKQSQLGTVLATAQGLTNGLPIVGSVLGNLLNPIYGLTSSVLNADVLVLVNACSLNPNTYKCPSF